jgi:hypothetical protein
MLGNARIMLRYLTGLMMTRTSIATALLLPVILALTRTPVRADSTWVYAVQLSATVQASPPQIALHWQPDQYGANSYTVYRKARDASSWGSPIARLSGSTSSYTDFDVTVGATYEYGVAKDASLGYRGYGYIYSGINAGLVENRGTLVLMVAANIAGSLAGELDRLQSDLVGDGWRVVRHDVSVDNTPDAIRNLIIADYNSDPGNVNAVFLFGHVPILQSGYLNYDSHGFRAMAADGFYGDMNNDWPTNLANSPSFFPSPVRLMVGRVDMYDMPGVGASPPWGSETDLLRQYLNKDHNWRFKLLTVPRRALMANRIGDIGGIAPAATGYRNFEPFVGPGNTIEANVQDNAAPNERWISMITAGAYLWTFGCGGGTDTSVSQLGTHGLYNDVWSTDIVGQGAQAIFVMLDGSHFAAWDRTDNILRSVLATPTYGLAACLAGGPHWYLHHMGLGETIGFGARLTMNNSTLYLNQSNYLAQAVYIGLMGDPTLRMEPIAPPSALSASSANGIVTLNWVASPDATAGYHVYRSAAANGPFTRVSGSGVSGTSFTDTPGSGTYTYMVRAVALQTNPSGSYYNPSQGVFIATSSSAVLPPPPILISVSTTADGVRLAWNTQPGTVYRVLASSQAGQGTWSDLSGSLTASDSTLTWIDTSAFSLAERFFRVISP